MAKLSTPRKDPLHGGADKKEVVSSVEWTQTFWPRGLPPSRVSKNSNFLTNQFDCRCANPQCLTTWSDTRLLKALDWVSSKFGQQIAIVMAMNCEMEGWEKGKILRLTSGDNYQLLGWFNRMYPELKPFSPEEYEYVQISV